MSVAVDDGKELTLAIASVGKMTAALDHLEVGDFMGGLKAGVGLFGCIF